MHLFKKHLLNIYYIQSTFRYMNTWEIQMYLAPRQGSNELVR